MITFTLTTPVNIGGLGSPLLISTLQLTGIAYSSTPQLALAGTGGLKITLTDTASGGQEVISYADASVLALWSTVAALPAAPQSLGDTIAMAIFAKLVADGKLPAGTATTA